MFDGWIILSTFKKDVHSGTSTKSILVNKTCNFTYSISTFSVISTIHPSNNQVLVDRAASVQIFYLVTSKFVEVFVENALIKFGMYNVDQPSQAIN